MYLYAISAFFIFFFLILLIYKNKKITALEKSLKKTVQLQESLEKFPLPIYFKNNQGKIINQNKAFLLSFGDNKQQALSELASLSNGEHQLEMAFDNKIQKSVYVYAKDEIGIVFDIHKEKQQKDALLNKKDYYEYSLKGSQIGCWQWDVATNKVAFSKIAYELLGYKEEDKKPTTLSDWLKIVTSYDLAKVNEAFSEHIRSESSHIFVQHRIKTSEEEKWLLIKGKMLKQRDSKNKKLYGTIEDITTIHTKTVAFKKEKELFTNFMDSLPALAFIKDKEGRYLYINTYYERLIGFKEWKNKKIEEIFEEELANNIKECDREAFYEGIQKHEEILPDESGQKYIFQTYKFPMDTEESKLLCGFGLDITKEKLYQERINLYAKIFDNTTESIIITDKDVKIITVNKAFCETTGFEEKELIGKNPNVRKSGRHSEQFYENFWYELLKNGSWRGEIFNKNKDGSILPELMNVNVIKDEKGEVQNFVSVSQSIEKQKIIENNLRKKAHFDVLTNLPNRSLFFDRLKQALLRNDRESDTLALAFVDLDDFKVINDTHGHKVGDSVLKEVAKRLLKCIRDTDTVGRFGGDEFVILLESIRHLNDIDFIIQKIIQEVTQPITINPSLTCNIGISIGISISPLHTKELKMLLDFADTAMYKAKNEGKNCYRIYKKH